LNPQVGIVVPTLGKRPEYLDKCLTSIRKAGEAYVVLVAPKSFDSSQQKLAGLIDEHIIDPEKGLSEAINSGFASMPKDVTFVNWLGDDDLLTPGAIKKASKALGEDANLVMVFGSCDYIDPDGSLLGTNNSGPWAVPLLRFGPDLIPQPGALFRRDAFESVGGLDPRWDSAFDFDLFIKLSKKGKLKFIDETLANFRWHPESLSVEFRKKSVDEASAVRITHLPSFLRLVSALWEFPVRQATLFAGRRVSALARRRAFSR
jgi:GT2 family glycosyltransferase